MEVATPQAELLEYLHQLGWELQSIRFSGGKYVARAKSEQSGLEIERDGNSEALALAAVYQYAREATALRTFVSAWQRHWYDQLHDIALAYKELPPYQANAVAYWQALAHENAQHAALIEQQIKIEYSLEPQPYESPSEMADDVHQKGHLLVSTVELEHPIWHEDDVVNFRVCHDVLGICQAGGGWSWPGANKAVASHMPLLSPEAQEALFVEVIGRTAYETVYRGIGARKVGLLSEFLRPVQDAEGQHVTLHVAPAIPVAAGHP
ncbi:MAG: hypothetical protein KGL39_37720 [Patescibacteria group bacterium]|nr:hypothetical protein [Patescibacteria group bacterium]